MYNKNEIVYFYFNVREAFGYAQLKCIDDIESLSSRVKVINKIGSIGGDYKNGQIISINQLQFVAFNGIKNFFFKEKKDIIFKIFK